MRGEAAEERVVRWYMDHPEATSTEAAAALELHPVSVRRIMSRARRAAHVPADAELHVCVCGDIHPYVPVMDLGLERTVSQHTNSAPVGASAQA